LGCLLFLPLLLMAVAGVGVVGLMLSPLVVVVLGRLLQQSVVAVMVVGRAPDA